MARPTSAARRKGAPELDPASALEALVRGFDAADRAAGGAIFGAAREDLPLLRRGLVTALMRVALALFADAHGLAPGRDGDATGANEPAWDALLRRWGALHEAWGGALFDPDAFPFLHARGAVPDEAVREVLARLAPIGRAGSGDVLEVERVGGVYEALVGTEIVASAGGRLAVVRGLERRRSGSHYTPRALTGIVVEAALAPRLATHGATSAGLCAMRVCDPSMGTGAFLVEACRRLGDHLAAAWTREGVEGDRAREARRVIAERGLFGVDRDPVAVEIARTLVWLATGSLDRRPASLDRALRAGDSLVGEIAPADGDAPPRRRATEALLASAPGAITPFHWHAEMPAVFASGGFDAVIGNPPWVAYAGRAAQPISAALFAYHLAHSPAFFGYRSLHGLFVHRSASLLAPGGRLGLVVPTSIADLDGYEPARRAHDALCDVDAALPDFGAHAFDGVFQPAMAVLSTRRGAPASGSSGPAPAPGGGVDAGPPARGKASVWTLARGDLDAISRALLDRLSAMAPLPAALFGERGAQTVGTEKGELRRRDRALPGEIAIREGSDVRAFALLPPRLFVDPTRIHAMRSAAGFEEVRLVIRQTARFPIAATSDGEAFRNSLLAGFGAEGYEPDVLLCYLNASPVRWHHFTRFRDARQGMPQVKVGHLRQIAAPIGGPSSLEELAAIGGALRARNDGVRADEQARIDAVVAVALGLDEGERALVEAWAKAHPAP